MLIMFSEIIAAQCENLTDHMAYAGNVQLSNVTSHGTHSYRTTLQGHKKEADVNSPG
jgi:hypothetical protein